MSKLLRSELKDIVKECLVEILAEGIGSTPSRSVTQKRTQQRHQSKRINETKRKSYLDNIVFNKSKNIPNEYGEIPQVNIKTNITKDPTLNAILADTAKSTLQEQIAAESRGSRVNPVSNDPISKIVDKNNPEDLFGASAASKWAQLAFFDEK